MRIYKLIITKVGDIQGGEKNGESVRRLQQLLKGAGVALPGGADGVWGKGTRAALLSFRQQVWNYSAQLAGEAAETQPDRPYIEPTDPVLLSMVARARMLIELPGKKGMAGVEVMHEWLVQNKVKYNRGAEEGKGDRVTYGVDGWEAFAVQRKSGAFQQGPVEMDCTTYVNLMLAVYRHGGVHTGSYQGECADLVHCARDRYGFVLLTREAINKSTAKPTKVECFEDKSQIQEAVEQRGSGLLYVLECWKNKQGSVGHMALMYNLEVYECTNLDELMKNDSHCIKSPLEKFLERHPRNYLFAEA
jgi:hypothetical protein